MIATAASTAKLKVICPSCEQKLDVSDVAPFSQVPCPVCGVHLCVPKPYGTYLLEEFIGSGGTSDVFRALDKNLDREIAVKMVRIPVNEDSALSDAFLDAAQKIAGLVHPSIVSIYSCDEADDKAFLAMQYMERGSLARRLKAAGNDWLPLEFALDILIRVTQGLEAAHRRGILHRHICPSNILFDGEDRARIGDFGLAAAGWRADQDTMTNLQACFGNLAYVSPETALHGTNSLHSDMYSLGVVAFELLASHLPFAPESVANAYAKRLVPTPAPLKEQRAELPEPLTKLVMAMLEEEPADRPASYTEVIAVLEETQRANRKKRLVNKGSKPRFGKAGSVNQAPSVVMIHAPHHHGLLFYVLVSTGLALLAALFFLILGHVLRMPWYVESIEPLFSRIASGSLANQAERDPFADLPDAPPLPEPLVTSADNSGHPATVASHPAAQQTDAQQPQPSLDEPDSPLLNSDVPPLDTSHAHPAIPDALASQRPRPADLDFKGAEAEIRAYIATLPAEWQALEKQHVQAISGMRPYLIRLFKFPYDGARGVRLANGLTVSAVVTLANERGLTLRVGSRPQTIKWSQLHPEQYPIFFEFYIQKRLEMGNPAATSKQQQREAVGADLYRLALLCDWYGDRVKARVYAAKAVSLDASLASRVNLLLGPLP